MHCLVSGGERRQCIDLRKGSGCRRAIKQEWGSAEFEKWLEIAKLHQLDSHMLSQDEVIHHFNEKPGHWKGAMITPSDGRAEPSTAVPAMARKLQAKGVLIREACAVRSIDTEAGKVAGVITEQGRVKAQSVVRAGGAWSTVFMGNLGVNLPQLTIKATVARTQPSPDFYSGAAAGAGIAIQRRQDGGYTVGLGGTGEHFISADSFRYLFKFLPVMRASAKSFRLGLSDNFIKELFTSRRWSPDEITPFEKTRVLNPEPSKDVLAGMRAGLKKYIPSLADVPFVESWAGMIDITPDVVPVMDEVADYPGLFLATGFSGHGFGFGPGAGRVMSNMVMGGQPEYDLDRFRLSRFTDGTPMVPGPSL